VAFADPQFFGKWLKERREALGYTQKELAQAASCSLSTLRKLEAGLRRPSRQVAELLAELMEIEAAEREAFLRFARSTQPVRAGVALPPVPTVAGERPGSSPVPASIAPAPGEWAPSAHNLPAMPTSFIGRQDQVDAVVGLLWRVEVRWLTLTGPPGTGKTRLGIQAAGRLAGEFAHGVHFVPLAPILDPAQVLPAVARALGVREASGTPVADRLKEYLRPKKLLLLLDNFEQVTESAADLAELLISSPDLKILATSRVPLHLYGEHEYPVPAMALPPASGSNGREPAGNPDALSGVESVQLFVKRAQAVRPAFKLDRANVSSVVEICRALEGLPLALELAAARVRHLDPHDLLTRLLSQGQLGLLASDMRNLPARQQTLRGAISWSYDLFTEREQRLFRHLGVFLGGMTQEAAAAVWQLDAPEALDALQALVGTSLVREELLEGGRHFSMLEAVREYALEQLASNGEEAHARELHAHYYLGLAEHNAALVGGSDEKLYLDLVDQEYANFTSALEYFTGRSADDTEMTAYLLRLARALAHFWYVRGSVAEGRSWLDAALDAQESWGGLNSGSGEDHTGWERRSDTLKEVGTLAWLQGDYPAARRYYEESLVISRRLGDRLGVAKGLNNLGNICNEEDDLESARRYYEESLVIAQEMGQQGGISRILNNLGTVAHKQSDYEAARSYYEESIVVRRQLDDKVGIALTLNNLGTLLSYIGELDEAHKHHREAWVIGEALSGTAIKGRSLVGFGDVASGYGQWHEAWDAYKRSLEMLWEADYKVGVSEGIEGLARVAAAVGDPRQSALLCGLADCIRDHIKSPRPAMDEDKYNRTKKAVLAHIDEGAWSRAWEAGYRLSPEEAITRALHVTLGEQS
jgi:predicted ATPase/transcriptional regulator with XRE-family HTH domain